MSGRTVCIILFLQIISVLSIRLPVTRVKRAAEDPTELGLNYPLTYDGIQYSGEVTVGTPRPGSPEQVLTIIFDTGSISTWLKSSRCTRCVSNDRQDIFYDSSKSTSFMQGGRGSWSVMYGDGAKVMGSQTVYDHIKLGSGPDALIVQHQGFGEAEDYDNQNNINGQGISMFQVADGLFGLGLHSREDLPGAPDPFFYSLVKQNNIQPVFGLHFKRNGNMMPDAEFVFGGHDEDLVETAFSHHPVLKRDKQYKGWLVQFNGIKVGQNVIFHEPRTAVIDTGASAIYGPSSIMEKINEIVFQNATFRKEYMDRHCIPLGGDFTKLPDVTLTLGTQEFLLTPKEYVGISITDTCSMPFVALDLPPNVDGANDFVIGTVFMTTYYPRFNFGEQRVEFARLKKSNG